jgi:hypothetical protein
MIVGGKWAAFEQAIRIDSDCRNPATSEET